MGMTVVHIYQHIEEMKQKIEINPPPAREVNPTLGLTPAKLLLPVGHVILPSVSVPSATVVNPMEVVTPDPEDEPHGSALGK